MKTILTAFSPLFFSFIPWIHADVKIEKERLILRRPFLPTKEFELCMITEVCIPLTGHNGNSGFISFNNYEVIRMPRTAIGGPGFLKAVASQAPKSARISVIYPKKRFAYSLLRRLGKSLSSFARQSLTVSR